jgi:EAL domain-containing protein (putative c-di-GMP-specific phosphodiesterase class I)/CheY-like chemotaxis protein
VLSLNKKILIVEDEALIAHRIKAQLTKLGYEVVDTVDNSADALSAISAHDIDLVLMDIVIKGHEDGIDTAIRIQNSHSIPVIFLTAYSDEKTVHRAELAHAYGFLVKPMNERELQAMVRIVLNRHARDIELLNSISEVQKHTDLLKASMVKLSSQVEDFNKAKLHDELQFALERDQLELYYQPQVNIRSRQIKGMEALLRWNHPTLGLIPPASFIPKLEHSGMIIDVGDWILGKACEQLHLWNNIVDYDLTMSINLSSKQIKPISLESRLKRVLSQYQVKPENIDLEITESILLENSSDEIEIFENLRAIGVHISIDDFGTGYSGLSYLQNFPFDTVKIDREFISNIESGTNFSSIVIAIINLAKDLGMSTVAEGVETRSELDFLMDHECEIAQGYYFSPPISASNCTKLLESGSILLQTS